MIIDQQMATDPAASRASRWKNMINTRTVSVTIVGLLLGLLVLPPLLLLLKGSVSIPTANNGSRFGFDYFTSILTQHNFLTSVSNSFIFAVCGAALAVFQGGIVAWLTERTNTPLKRLAYVTTITSLATPYILYVGAWMMLLSRSGPVNAYYRMLTGSFRPLVNVYSLPVMIFIEGLLWSPMVFLLIGATLRNFNPSLEEAARMSGANHWQIFRRVTLKLSMPSILALLMLVFIRSLEAFEVPALVGIPGRVRMLTTDIYQTLQMVPPDLGSASALSAILLVLVAALLYCYNRLTRRAEQFATVTGKNFRPAQIDLGRWRYLGAAVIICNFVMLLVLPLLALFWASLLPFYQPFTFSAVKLVSLKNYVTVLGGSRYLMLITNTMIVAAVTATVVMVLAAVTAWLKVRRMKGSNILDALASMPLVFPGVILGVAVMQLFLNIPIGIYGTIWIIVWAFVINSMPYGVRYSFVGMIQLHRELEEAAIMAGASPMTGFRRIVIPLLLPSIFAGWVFIFLLSTRVLALPVLLSGPSSQTMAVSMFDLLSNGQEPELAAVGLLWSAGMTVIVAASSAILRKSGVNIHGA